MTSRCHNVLKATKVIATKHKSAPIAKEAFLLVKDAPNQVAFEILKTGYVNNERNSGVSTKSCVPASLFCSRRRKAVDRAYLSASLDKNRDNGDLNLSL